MIKYTGINRLLNYLPQRTLNCSHCSKKFQMKFGQIRYSKKEYGGPYCPKCGNKARK